MTPGLAQSRPDKPGDQLLTPSGRATNLKAFLILLCLTVIFYWKIVLSHQFSLLLSFEGTNQAYAWFNYWVATIRQGIWPIWDPFTFSGHAFAGEMQTGAFYPLYLVFLAVPFHHGVFSPALYHVFYVLTHALCAWFVFLLAREFRLSFFAGLVAGVAFSLGGVLVRFNAWPHMLQSGIWLPIILLLLMRALHATQRRPAIAYSALAGLSLALSILAGGLHLVIMQAIVILSAGIFYAATSTQEYAEHDDPRTVCRRAAIVIAVCGAFALAGGAVQLLPSAEYSRLALRFAGPITLPATEKIPYNDMGDALWPHSFLGLVISAFAGSPGSGEYSNPYMGVLPLLLAIIGIWKQWSYLWVRYLAGLAVAACLYSLGSFSILHGLLYAVTPWLWMAREASRFLYLTDFAIALLAAFGIDALFSQFHPSSWESLTAAFKWIAVACAIALAYPFVLGKGDLSVWISLSLLLVLLTYGLYRYIIAGHYGRWARFLVMALIFFDLSAFDWSEANQIAESAKGHDEMARLLSLRGAADFLRTRPGPFRVELAINQSPNIGDMFGIEETFGAAVTLQTDYDKFRGHTDLLNTRYTLRPASATESNPVYKDSAWKVYERPSAYPRAWLVHATEVEPDPAKLLTRLDAPGFDPHRIALLPAPLNSGLDTLSTPDGDQATARKSRQDQVDVDVHSSGRALLVLSELFYPGWTATMNGRPAPIVKVDGALRGIAVPNGASQVRLSYSPAAFFIGLTLSAATFLTGAVLAVTFLRRV
jgi:hypothetical protein